MKKLFATLSVAFAILTFLQPFHIVNASDPALGDQLDQVEQEIKKLQDEKNKIQSLMNANQYTIAGYNSQLSKLYGEVEIYNKEIQEVDLQIKQLELSIKQLDQEIATKKADIEKTEASISELEFESNQRLKESYMKFRMNTGNTDIGNNLIFTTNINSYFKNSQYKEYIQSDTNDFLLQLAELKSGLNAKKKSLESNLAQVQKDKELVDIKAQDLNKKKEEVNVKMAIYYQQVNALAAKNAQYNNTIAVFSQDEAKKRAQAEYIRQQIIGGFSSIGTNTQVVAGTIIGLQGCTGYCFGEHLHFSVYLNGSAVNPCGQLESGALGCGSGGPLKTPLRGSVSYNSGFGNRCFWNGGQTDCSFHDGVDATGSPSGAPVYAPIDGYIRKGYDCWHRDSGYGVGCANYIIICQNQNCNQGYKLGFWHLSQM